jgi:hypothetical protein
MIESYGFGYIVIEGKRHTSDVIIFPDRVESHWLRQSGHRLVPEDLERVVTEETRTLVVGMGHAELVRVPAQTLDYLRPAGFEVIVQRTGQACETYNCLAEQGPVIAALHLSC